MDCEFFRRYLGRRVSVNGYQEKIVGTLAKVDYDFIVLTNAQVKDRLETDGWFERIQEQEGGDMLGPTAAETVVSANHIFALTCLEDDIVETPLESAESKPTTAVVQVAPEITPEQHLTSDPLTIEIGVGLIAGLGLISEHDNSLGGELATRITQVRNHLAQELGILLPKVRIRDQISLGQNEYRILLDDHVVGSGSLEPKMLLVIDPKNEVDCDDVQRCVEPVGGHSAFWIESEKRLAFEMRQLTVVDPLIVLTTHFADVARRFAAEILTPELVRDLIDQTRLSQPVTINEFIPEFVTIPELHTLLQQLLAEQVSIRQLGTIVESLGRCRDETDAEDRLRIVRKDLARTICDPLKNDERMIAGLELEPDFSAFISDLDKHESGSKCLRTQKMIAHFIEDRWRAAGKEGSPVLLIEEEHRLRVRSTLTSYLTGATFLSFGEIDEPQSLEVLSTLELNEFKVQRENQEGDHRLGNFETTQPR